MNEKKNEAKEERTDNMKDKNNTEITDFDELRTEQIAETEKKNTDKKTIKKDDKEKTESNQDKMKKEEKTETDEEKPETDEEKPETDKEKAKKEEKAEPGKVKTENEEKPESGKEKTEKEKKAEPGKEKAEKEEKAEPGKERTEKEKKAESGKERTEKEKKAESGKEKAEKEEKPEPDQDKKEEEKRDSEKKDPSNNAISGSKKLADIKAAKEKLEDSSANNKTKQSIKNTDGKNKKSLWIALSGLAGIFLIVYIAGFVYFSSHFYKDTDINGVSVSGMNKETAKNTLESFYKNYKLKVVLIDDSEKLIDGKDISMVIKLNDEFNNCLKKQNSYLWFVNMFKHYDFTVSADTSWEEAALEDIFSDMSVLKKKNMESPQNAYVGVEDGKFVIVKEVLGTTIIEQKFKESIEEGLRNVVAELNLLEQGCYELPKVYEDDTALKKELDAKKEYADHEIKLQLDDLTIEPGMELYSEVLEKKGDSYEVSETKIQKYVEKLAEKYDTLGTDRTFTTSWGDKQIQTHGEAFGYVMNQEDTVKALSKALKEKKAATVEVVFDKKGYTLKDENDIGNTYIEVNLSEQHVYAYKDGKKVAEGDCVSGNESAGRGTCTGLYAIQDKLSPTVLRGEKKPVTKTITKKNKKGKKVKVEKTTYEYEYESPVTYWMQFNGGIGLHDAAGWRSTYGGSIYYYSGSHGCVNLPLDLAKTLYENFDVGTPVVVYFWDNENRK